MAEHSRLAVALAEAIIPSKYVLADDPDVALSGVLAEIIDGRLAKIREAYKPEELARCPIVTHHPDGPCSACNTAAMRDFLLLPSQL